MSNLNKQIEAVIIGGAHHNTLGVIRSLGAMKIAFKLIIVDNQARKRNFVTVSKYVKKKNLIVLSKNSSILDELIKIGSDGIKRSIICCSDDSAELIEKNYLKISSFFYCPHSNISSHSVFSKLYQFKTATSSKILVPKYGVFKKNEIIQWDSFPCITKPERVDAELKTHKSDIYICNNKEELGRALNKVQSKTFFIQELIIKKNEFQFIGCSLDDGRVIVLPGYTNIIRQPFNTNTGYLFYSSIENLKFDIDSIKEFITKIGYNGLFSVEFVRDLNGDDYFLEMNLRNDGNAYCVTKSGVNLPYIWCYYNFFNSLPECAYHKIMPLYFMPEFSDFKLGIKTVGFFKWFKQFLSSKAHAIFDLKDMKPFFYKLFSSLFHH